MDVVPHLHHFFIFLLPSCVFQGVRILVHVGMLVNMHIKVCTQITAYCIPPIIHFCSTGKERG